MINKPFLFVVGVTLLYATAPVIAETLVLGIYGSLIGIFVIVTALLLGFLLCYLSFEARPPQDKLTDATRFKMEKQMAEMSQKSAAKASTND